MIQVAFARDMGEAELIRGLLAEQDIPCFLQPAGIDGRTIGSSLLMNSSQRVMVNDGQAEAAQRLIEGALSEGEMDAMPEIANQTHLEAAQGRGPRNYTLLGAYTRAMLWSIVAFALFAAVFFLLRA